MGRSLEPPPGLEPSIWPRARHAQHICSQQRSVAAFRLTARPSQWSGFRRQTGALGTIAQGTGQPITSGANAGTR